MNQTDRLSAIEYIRKIMEKYWRGVGAQDEKLVRSVLAEDAEYNPDRTLLGRG